MSVTLPLTPELAAGFAAVAVHASADKVRPITTGMRVSHRYLTATDMYSVARFEHTTYAESVERHGESGPADPGWTVVIPADVAAWASKLKPVRYVEETLTITDDTATLTRGGVAIESRTFVALTGNFPPVERLIPEISDAAIDAEPFSLGAAMLAKLAKSAAPLARAAKAKDLPMRFQLTPAPAHSRFPGPVLGTVGDRFLILAQPVKRAA